MAQQSSRVGQHSEKEKPEKYEVLYLYRHTSLLDGLRRGEVKPKHSHLNSYIPWLSMSTEKNLKPEQQTKYVSDSVTKLSMLSGS